MVVNYIRWPALWWLLIYLWLATCRGPMMRTTALMTPSTMSLRHIVSTGKHLPGSRPPCIPILHKRYLDGLSWWSALPCANYRARTPQARALLPGIRAPHGFTLPPQAQPLLKGGADQPPLYPQQHQQHQYAAMQQANSIDGRLIAGRYGRGEMGMHSLMRLMVFATLISRRPDHEHWASVVLRAYKCGMYRGVRWTCKLYIPLVIFSVTMYYVAVRMTIRAQSLIFRSQDPLPSVAHVAVEQHQQQHTQEQREDSSAPPSHNTQSASANTSSSQAWPANQIISTSSTDTNAYNDQIAQISIATSPTASPTPSFSTDKELVPPHQSHPQSPALNPRAAREQPAVASATPKNNNTRRQPKPGNVCHVSSLTAFQIIRARDGWL